MDKKNRLILLTVLAVLIVIVLSIGVTIAFMKTADTGSKVTEISISSCAKIKLEGTNSINLTNSYPMSKNRGLQTTPYTFTVLSYCDTLVGFDLYLATLNTNTLAASDVHYIITNKGSKDILEEGTLTSDVSSTFTDTDKTELNAGLGGTYGNIYKLFNAKVPKKGNATYDLYLYIDENSTSYQGTTFTAGVAVKSYEREDDITLANYVKLLYTGTQGVNNLYYHDSNLTNGAGDNSYRYAGLNPNNYVCFGSTDATCPTDNLYRIIGVFGDQVKLIKSTKATSALLGTDGDYYSDTAYYWNYKNDTSINSGFGSNTWSTSLLNKTNLNTNYINNIGSEWASKIAQTTWKVGGNTSENIYSQVPSVAYQNEIVNPVTTNSTDNATTFGPSASSKIGLMYVSDYLYAAGPDAWTKLGYSSSGSSYDYRSVTGINWLYLGSYEWTISRGADNSGHVFLVSSDGYVDYSGYAYYSFAVRPVFYLESSATYSSGDGASDSPIRLG